MDRRLELHDILCNILGSRNVYYQPPASLKMQYDAIRYTKSSPSTRKADDTTYSRMSRYELTLISRNPDHPAIDELMKLPYCTYDRCYASDNLYHDVMTIYY